MSIVGSKAHKELILYCYYVLLTQNKAHVMVIPREGFFFLILKQIMDFFLTIKCHIFYI